MIELDVIFHTDTTAQLKECGIEYTLKQCDVRIMTFYSINAISPFFDEDGTEYCYIHSNGDRFIGNYTYEEARKVIKANLYD